MNWELIESHTQDGFTINTYVAPETDDPRDHFLVEGEAQMGLNESLYSVIEDIEQGNLAWFMVKVEASKNGIVLADEYLGGCCYQTETDFLDVDGYWTDMCETALHDAKQTLRDLTEAFQQ